MIGRRCAEFRPRNSPPIGPDLFGSPHPRCGNLAQTKSYYLVKLANAIQLNKQNRRRVALIFWNVNAAGIFCSNIEPSFSTMLSTPLAISDNVSTTHSHGKLTTRETNHTGNQPTMDASSISNPTCKRQRAMIRARTYAPIMAGNHPAMRTHCEASYVNRPSVSDQETDWAHQ